MFGAECRRSCHHDNVTFMVSMNRLIHIIAVLFLQSKNLLDKNILRMDLLFRNPPQHFSARSSVWVRATLRDHDLPCRLRATLASGAFDLEINVQAERQKLESSVSRITLISSLPL